MGQEDTAFGSRDDTPNAVPVLPLRDVVVYPHMVIPLFVGREKSIRALDQAMQDNKQILLIAQQSAEVDDPQPDDLYDIGTIANILSLQILGTDDAETLTVDDVNGLPEFNDTEPTIGWLDELIAAFDRFPNIGLAGSKLQRRPCFPMQRAMFRVYKP